MAERERWLVDSFELTEGTVRDVELRDGLYGTAPLVGDNGTVPNRSGEVWRAKRRGPASFVLNVWLGTDAGRDQVEALYANLIRAVGDGSRLPLWTRYLPDGSVRQCFGEVVSGFAPAPIGQSGMRIAIEVRVPDGIWESTVDVLQETALRPASGSVLSLDQFADVSAPMERLLYVISGPAVDATVTDVTTGTDGEWFKYVGTIPSGASLRVDSETWGLTAGGSGLVLDRGAFYHSGPRFLTVRTPLPGGTPAVRFNYANGGTTTRLSISGRKAYAV